MSYLEKFPDPAKHKSRDLWDLTDAAIVVGVALTYLPAGLITGGAVLVAIAIFNGGDR